MTEDFINRLENTVRKTENAGQEYFILFQQFFQMLSEPFTP